MKKSNPSYILLSIFLLIHIPRSDFSASTSPGSPRLNRGESCSSLITRNKDRRDIPVPHLIVMGGGKWRSNLTLTVIPNHVLSQSSERTEESGKGGVRNLK